MDNWPTSLPVPMVESAQYQAQDNTIRTQMDSGPSKVRRRFTNVPEDVTFSVMLTKAQLETLDDFIAVTLKDVLPFTWQDFRKPAGPENVVVMRFKRRPQYQPVAAGLWKANLELEQLTTFQGTYLLDVSPLTT